MSSADFRHIASRSEKPKSERLFRAAVSAYCSLTRPTRRDATQLDDLAMPLVGDVTAETKRYCAAALSECSRQPAGLVRRLCDEPVEICAALLSRSPALTDIDLITLIGRHGLDHARAIARRPNLNPTLKNLIRALEGTVLDIRQDPAVEAEDLNAAAAVESRPTPTKARPGAAASTGRPATAEDARDALRGMMQPSGKTPVGHDDMQDDARVKLAWHGPVSAYDKLRSTAFTGVSALFETALADLLQVDYRRAHKIVHSSYYDDLQTALRSLNVATAEAFVIVSAIFPGRFSHAEAIRLFHQGFEAMHPEKARDIVSEWRGETTRRQIREAVASRPPAFRAGNDDMILPPVRPLKAS